MTNLTLVGLLSLLILLAGCAAQHNDTHGTTDESISPEALVEYQGTVRFLDVRSIEEYERGHLESAVALPLEQISESRLDALHVEKDDFMVAYANSDVPSKKAKTLLEAMGYTNVKYLAGGLVHWEEDGFTTVSGKMDTVFDEEQEEKRSSLVVEPDEVDFGTILRERGPVSTIFAIHNEGDEQVDITELSTSCGCTSAEVSTEQVLPGETVSLEVTFDPNFHKEPLGRFSRTAFIQTSEGAELQAKIWVQIDDE